MNVARTLFTVIGVLLLIPIVAVGTLAFTSGYSDGPSVVFGGGALVAGELVTGPEPDWSFTRDIQNIELQLVDPPRSRLVLVIEYEGKLYVISDYMGSRVGRLWKRWPAQAERDGRAIIRIAGKRYERTLVRIKTGVVVEGVTAERRRKYGSGSTAADVESGTTWLFELAPPKSDMNGAAS